MREVSTAPHSARSPVIQSAGFLIKVLKRIMAERRKSEDVGTEDGKSWEAEFAGP
jgi:hypothetical protein